MNWANFWFGVLLVIGGAIGGALLMWAWLSWPVRRLYPDDLSHLADAQSRHPSARRDR